MFYTVNKTFRRFKFPRYITMRFSFADFARHNNRVVRLISRRDLTARHGGRAAPLLSSNGGSADEEHEAVEGPRPQQLRLLQPLESGRRHGTLR